MTRAPEITVAAIAEQNGKFLTIEEHVRGKLVLNQPAGHMENHETLAEAVARECFEESGWHFEPTHLCGIYTWTHPTKNVTIVRFAFCGRAHSYDPEAILDDGIERSMWMTPRELFERPGRLRNPMVGQAIHDFKAGRHYPLEMITSMDSEPISELSLKANV
ncbi:MAG: NUDIX hydrolase [Gammaproteobacteria bacterium]